jgi:tetraacyldisaccharide 4'-kinase
MMTLLRYLLLPVVPFYYLVTWLRNLAYDLGIKPSKQYEFPIICVGNLSVGGTGKSPFIEYLIRLLKSDYRLATLSRGYKRTTKGFVLADENSSAMSIGDEPYQFYSKFKNEIHVGVNENRQEGISQLRALEEKPQVILLDDAFQHRKVTAGFNILLTTYANLYTKDWVLPTGNLREPRAGARRAQIIVVTKCPVGLSEEDKLKIAGSIKPKSYQHVFFSTISYAEEVYSNTSTLMLNALEHEFTLVTGIADAQPLVAYLESKALKFDHINYKDHYIFQQDDIAILEQKSLIITTEKDYVRLKAFPSIEEKLYYLPIEVELDKHAQFDQLVLEYVKS